MNNIRVNKAALLEILKKNKAEHRDIFLKAQDGFRTKAIEILDAQLKSAREGGNPNIQVLTRLVQPEDHTDDYDRVIGMLEMSVDDVVTLEDHEYMNYVTDQWNWSRSWAVSNSHYTTSGKFAQAMK